MTSECFSSIRYLLAPLRLLPAGATVAGRDSHPLRHSAFHGARSTWASSRLSKPITAVAVLKLVEDGLLDLDARVFRDLLADIGPERAEDIRMNRITVRDLLRHSGGFDRDNSGDPQWMQWESRGDRRLAGSWR